MANDININESAILETLNAKIDYDGGNYPSSGLERKVNSTRVSKSGDTMTGSLISEQSSYYQFVAKSTVIDATATPTAAQYVGIDFKDKNNVRLGWFGIGHDKNGTTYFNMMNFQDASDGFLFPRCTTKATTTSSAAPHKVAVITQNYINGNTWYRVWSDGWIEQGGRVSVPYATTSVTFAKAFTTTAYYFGAPIDAKDFVYEKNKVTFLSAWGSGYAYGNVSWYACGY
jgi:hypothetical protein